MKRSKLNSMLVAVIVLAVVATAFAVRTPSAATTKATNAKQIKETKPKQDLTMYYWYDATMNYLDRQNTIQDEMDLTTFDESLSNPKTLQEYGFAPSGVQPNPYPPTPLNPSNPDKILWSHP
jgi:hypothetical protein